MTDVPLFRVGFQSPQWLPKTGTAIQKYFLPRHRNTAHDLQQVLSILNARQNQAEVPVRNQRRALFEPRFRRKRRVSHQLGVVGMKLVRLRIRADALAWNLHVYGHDACRGIVYIRHITFTMHLDAHPKTD